METTAVFAPPPAPLVHIPGWPWTHLLRMRDDPLALMDDGMRLGADVVALRFGFVPAYVLYSPELVHRALVPGDTVWKGTRGARLMRRFLGPGLLTTEGAAWKERRKLAQPRFRREALEGMPAAVTRHAHRMLDRWDGSAEVDVAPALSELALGVVCEVMFGLDPGDDAAIVHEALTEVLGGFLRMMTLPLPGMETWPLPSARRHQHAVAALDAVVDRLIARRRAQPPVDGDLLADWLQAADRGELGPDDLRAEVITMLLAGHETTANAMAFALAFLGRHRDEQGRVRSALDAGDSGPLDRAFAETLRLRPPAWVMARATTAPMDLGVVTAKAGSFLFVPIAAIQRDPRWWVEPDQFLPDRHLSLSPAAKAAYLPFGLGGRKCIGEHFARAEARIVLGETLRRFELHCDAVPGGDASVTLRPRGPVQVRLRPRPLRG